MIMISEMCNRFRDEKKIKVYIYPNFSREATSFIHSRATVKASTVYSRQQRLLIAPSYDWLSTSISRRGPSGNRRTHLWSVPRAEREAGSLLKCTFWVINPRHVSQCQVTLLRKVGSSVIYRRHISHDMWWRCIPRSDGPSEKKKWLWFLPSFFHVLF